MKKKNFLDTPKKVKKAQLVYDQATEQDCKKYYELWKLLKRNHILYNK